MITVADSGKSILCYIIQQRALQANSKSCTVIADPRNSATRALYSI